MALDMAKISLQNRCVGSPSIFCLESSLAHLFLSFVSHGLLVMSGVRDDFYETLAGFAPLFGLI